MVRTYNLNNKSPAVAAFPLMVFLMSLTGSLVFIEPAPVDVLTLGFAILAFLAGLKLPRSFLVPLFFLGVFLLGNFLSAMFVPDPMTSVTYLAVTAYLVISLAYFASLMYYDYERLMPLFWRAYAIAGVVATIAGIIGFFGLTSFSDMFTKSDRAAGTFKDPNVYGPYLIAITLFLINTIEFRTGLKRAISIVLIAFLSFGIIISFSRGAIGTFLLCLGLMLFIKLRIINSYRLFIKYLSIGSVIFAMALGALTVAFLSTDKLSNMLEMRAKVVQDYDVNEGGRFSTQAKAIRISVETPVGIGPGRGEEVMGLVPHNVYLLILVENGIIGFIGWVCFVAVTMYSAVRFLKNSVYLPPDFLPVFCTLVGTVLESFIIDTIHWRHFYVLFGVMWGIMLAVRHQQGVLGAATTTEAWREKRRHGGFQTNPLPSNG